MTPIYAFIDASIYEGHHFQFSTEPLLSIQQAADQGFVRLLIPKVAHAEVEKRFAARVPAMQETLREAKNKCTVAKGTGIEPLASLLGGENWVEALQSELRERYSMFVRGRSVAVSRPPHATNEVFAAYFKSLPPFDSAEKKHEFPDAFVISALRAWQKKSGEMVHVVSADGDFRRALAREAGFTVCDSTERLLRYIYETKIGHNKAAEALTKAERRKISAALRSAFHKRVIVVHRSEEQVDSNRVRATSVRTHSISKIEITGTGVRVRLTASFRFTVAENTPVNWQSEEDPHEEADDPSPPTRLPFHRVYGDEHFQAELPAVIVYKPSRNMKAIESITHVEINDGTPIELSKFRYDET